MISKRAYSGNWSTTIFCKRCDARLDIRKSVWLLLDQRTGTYTDQDVPDEFSQGAFAFGKNCTETEKRMHTEAAAELAAKDEALRLAREALKVAFFFM